MKRLALTTVVVMSMFFVGLFGLPVNSMAQSSNQQKYLGYSAALTTMSTDITTKRNMVREPFPYNPDLFDSKNVTKITRRDFPPPDFEGREGATFQPGFKRPTQPGNVSTQPTGDRPGSTPVPTQFQFFDEEDFQDR